MNVPLHMPRWNPTIVTFWIRPFETGWSGGTHTARPVPLARRPPQLCQVIRLTKLVGSPPKSIRRGLTLPRPVAREKLPEARPRTGW